MAEGSFLTDMKLFERGHGKKLGRGLACQGTGQILNGVAELPNQAPAYEGTMDLTLCAA